LSSSAAFKTSNAKQARSLTRPDKARRFHLEARAGIGCLSSNLHDQNERLSEVTKQNRIYTFTTEFNPFGVRFGIHSSDGLLRAFLQLGESFVATISSCISVLPRVAALDVLEVGANAPISSDLMRRLCRTGHDSALRIAEVLQAALS
jgi:hypothetical protein